MRAINAFGGLLLVLTGIVLMGVIAAAVLLGMAWVTVHIYPWIVGAAELAFAADLLLFLPLAIFHATRPTAAACFIASGWVFGITAWVSGFLTAYDYWGVAGVLVGICFAGIGVIPIAALAALLHGAWWPLGILGLGILLWIAAIWFGNFLEARCGSNMTDRSP